MPQRPIDDTPDEETLTFEAAVLRDVTGNVTGALTELLRVIFVLFESINATTETVTEAQAEMIGLATAARIRDMGWEPMRPTLAEATATAHRLGVERAARRFPDAVDRAKARSTRTRKRSTPNIDTALLRALRDAETLARKGIRTRTEVAQVAAKVSGAKARLQGTVRSVAHESLNTGTLDVAKKMRLRVLWVAERNACLDCLAHAGYVANPGDLFPGVSFDPMAKRVPAVPTCPLHPNCRCQLRVTDLPAGPPPTDRSSLSPAARLAAEARRSVVYQWTEYESGPAMQRAAEALLSAGAGLPASVETRARRMLRAKKRGGNS